MLFQVFEKIASDINEQQKRLTLMHELIHVILDSIGENEHDEKMVESLSHSILGLFKDNPRLSEYLFKEIENK